MLIAGLGTIQGIFLALIIYFHPKSDKSVSLFLSLYILSFSVVMTIPFVLKTIGWQGSWFVEPFPLIVGPLLYLYVRSFKETITLKKAFPHLIFFILYFFIAYFVFEPFRAKYIDVREVPASVVQHPIGITVGILKASQYVLYYFLSRRELISYQRSIRHIFSDTSQFDLQWARLLVNGYMLIVVMSVVLVSLMFIYPARFSLFFVLDIALITPHIYLASYKGITQATVWQIRRGVNKEKIETEMHDADELKIKRVYEKLINSKQQQIDGKDKDVLDRIIVLVDKDKLYQETELTLQDLADKIQYPSYLVSQAINEGLNKNFYDLINGYRVEEAKLLLLDPKNENYTILSVGFEAGFNSKTTFNTVFKKFTGQTPTEFRTGKLADSRQLTVES